MMMRRQYVSAAALAVLGSWGMTTNQENAELVARVEQLEAQIEAVETYLGQQATSADSLQGALQASEQAGFAYGINPESRHILLEAWHARAKAVGTNVPGLDPKKTAEVTESSRSEVAKK
ncbi:MAG: Tfp pilus assembly protein FimV [Chlamydiales bacterium]|jgi:Tfp pilus assembly protein FimV